MTRRQWTPPPSDGTADLTIWWATLTDDEQLLLRHEAWSLASNPPLVEFLALTDCPLVTQPFDPTAHHVLTNPGRFLTFLQDQDLVGA
jgi:hypothetical protein